MSQELNNGISKASKKSKQRKPQTLRKRLSVAGLAIGISIVICLAILAVLGLREQTSIREASARIVEEQRIGDAIIRGVMRQMTIAGDPTSRRIPNRLATFDSLSANIYHDLRLYLFRELSPAERLQIEAVKEEHQQMEVAARRVMSSYGSTNTNEVEANETMVLHAYQLLDALHGFTDLREGALSSLANRQNESLRNLMLTSLGFVVITFFGQLLLTLQFIRKRVTRPLSAFADAVRNVGAGDLAVRMPTATDREFEDTFEAFNTMAMNLAKVQSDLKSRNRALADALNQVRATQNELIQAEKLGAIGRMTAGLAHELNNPLTTVLTTSELLAARLEDRDPPSSSELRSVYLDPIRHEASRARLLIRSLLQFARRSESQIGPVSLRESISVVQDLRANSLASAGVKLVVHDIPDVAIIAERQQLQVVLLNILNNAVDVLFERGSGVISIAGRIDSTFAELSIEDNGPGLRDPSRVFEAFYTTKGVGEGTGLGLALAERFVTAFGGTISARNAPEGGAQFVLRFRITENSVRSVTPPYNASQPILSGALQPASHSITTSSVSQEPTSDSGNGANAGRTNHCVLVVDDEPAIRRAEVLLLQRLNLNAISCASVAEAKEYIRSGKADAILCDVRMPEESGVALFRWIRNEYPELESRFIFVTGDTETPELAQLAADSCIAMISKPFIASEFSDQVLGVLSGPRLPQA